MGKNVGKCPNKLQWLLSPDIQDNIPEEIKHSNSTFPLFEESNCRQNESHVMQTLKINLTNKLAFKDCITSVPLCINQKQNPFPKKVN